MLQNKTKKNQSTLGKYTVAHALKIMVKAFLRVNR